MKAYTIREASKKLTATPTKLKQWEKELQGIIVIPRTKTGARIYTEKELARMNKAKEQKREKAEKERHERQLKKQHEWPACTRCTAYECKGMEWIFWSVLYLSVFL